MKKRRTIADDMDPAIVENVRQNMYAVKETLGLTFEKIANATGITHATVKNYYYGKLCPSEHWIEKFCSVYRIDKEWLFNGTDEPKLTGPLSDFDLKDTSDAGKRVAELRSSLKLSLNAFRKPLDISLTMLSRIENGHARLTRENAAKIERAYGVGVDWILYGDESRKEYPVTEDMIEFLWKHKGARRRLWEAMNAEQQGRLQGTFFLEKYIGGLVNAPAPNGVPKDREKKGRL